MCEGDTFKSLNALAWKCIHTGEFQQAEVYLRRLIPPPPPPRPPTPNSAVTDGALGSSYNGTRWTLLPSMHRHAPTDDPGSRPASAAGPP